MSEQNYANHRRFVPLYHFVLSILIVLTLIGSVVNLIKSAGSAGFYSASLIVAMNAALVLLFFYSRVFALRAQDRVIRAEENMRHYIMTGKMLDERLTMRQIVGLRFASDDEYLSLIKSAIKEHLSEDDIKKAIVNWRADNDRM